MLSGRRVKLAMFSYKFWKSFPPLPFQFSVFNNQIWVVLHWALWNFICCSFINYRRTIITIEQLQKKIRIISSLLFWVYCELYIALWHNQITFSCFRHSYGLYRIYQTKWLLPRRCVHVTRIKPIFDISNIFFTKKLDFISAQVLFLSIFIPWTY